MLAVPHVDVLSHIQGLVKQVHGGVLGPKSLRCGERVMGWDTGKVIGWDGGK